MKYNVPLHVRSSLSDAPGTMVTSEDKSSSGALESVVVQGVTSDAGEARVMLVGTPDRPGIVALVFGRLAAANVSVDMIIQSASRKGADEGADDARTEVTFTVAKSDLGRVEPVIESLVAEIGAQAVRYDDRVAKVSIVGLGMRSHAGVAAKMFEILASEGINIQAIATSEIKISCLVAARYAELAVRALHHGFGLDRPAARGAGQEPEPGP